MRPKVPDIKCQNTLSLYPDIRFFGLPGVGFAIFGLYGRYIEDS